MTDILSVYMSYVTSLLDIRVPGVGVSVGSLWLGALALFFGAHVIRWIFGVNFNAVEGQLKNRVTLNAFKKKGSKRSKK